MPEKDAGLASAPILKGQRALIVGVANDRSIAFAPREALEGRVTDCPRDGFLTAMDVSCWSFLDLTRRAETSGGARSSP